MSSSMVSTGRSMSATGRTLNRNVTLPLLAIGAASTKMALDYNSAFTKISAISNTSAEDVARWKEEVKGLAEATGRDPMELAEALFFLASAGLETSQVMDTLKATAKASAVGLGEMTDIAKLTANVLNAYKSSGITAAQATDTLVAAVKAGTAEPEEFAGAMGRILPIASRARVGFDQVAASLAALSNIGLDVNEGVTAMRGLLQSLVAPTDMAREAMHKIGLSAQDLLDAFQEDGILGALTLLEERTAKAADSEAEMFDIMRRIVPNVRALTGQLGLTGENADQVAKIFDQVTDSTGALGDAMRETEKDPAFQMARRFAQLKVAAIELGDTLIPIAQDVVGVIGDLAEGFAKLSPATKESIVKWGLLAIALGPVLRLLGAIVTIGGKAIGVLVKVASAGAATSAAGAGAGAAGAAATGAAGAITLGVAALAVEIYALTQLGPALDSAVKTWSDRLVQGGHSAQDAANALHTFTDAVDGSLGHLDAHVLGTRVLAGAFEDAESRVKGYRSGLERLGVSLSDAAQFTYEHFLRTGDLTSAMNVLEGAFRSWAQTVPTGHQRAAEAAADNRNKVDALRQVYGDLPKTARTKVEAPGIDSAINAVRTYKNWLESIPETVRTTLVVSREQGFGGPTEQDHAGGLIMHAGGSVFDALRAREVPAILERGEFVVRKEAVRQLGLPFLERLNRMHFGGGVGRIGRGSRLGRAPMARQPDFSQGDGSRGPVRLVGILETEWGPAEVHGWILDEVSELGRRVTRAGLNRRPVG